MEARLAAEVAAVRAIEQELQQERVADQKREALDAAAAANGSSQECQCCFGDFHAESMVRLRLPIWGTPPPPPCRAHPPF